MFIYDTIYIYRYIYRYIYIYRIYDVYAVCCIHVHHIRRQAVSPTSAVVEPDGRFAGPRAARIICSENGRENSKGSVQNLSRTELEKFCSLADAQRTAARTRKGLALGRPDCGATADKGCRRSVTGPCHCSSRPRSITVHHVCRLGRPNGSLGCPHNRCRRSVTGAAGGLFTTHADRPFR